MNKITIDKILKTPTGKKLRKQASSTLEAANADDLEHQLQVNLGDSNYYKNVTEAIAAAIKHTVGLGFDDDECMSYANKIVGEIKSGKNRFRNILNRAKEIIHQQFTQPKMTEQEENYMGEVGRKDRGHDPRMNGNWNDSPYNTGSTGSGSWDFLMRPGEAPGPGKGVGKSPFPSGQMQMAQQSTDEYFQKLEDEGQARAKGYEKGRKTPLTPKHMEDIRDMLDRVRNKPKSKKPSGERMSGQPAGWESGTGSNTNVSGRGTDGSRNRDRVMGRWPDGGGRTYNTGSMGWETSGPSVWGGTDGTYGPT